MKKDEGIFERLNIDHYTRGVTSTLGIYPLRIMNFKRKIFLNSAPNEINPGTAIPTLRLLSINN